MNRKTKWLLLCGLSVLVTAVAFVYYMVTPSESQQAESRKIETLYAEFTSAILNERWEFVLEKLTPVCRKQLAYEIYPLVQASLASETNSSGGPNAELLHSDVVVFRSSLEKDPVILKKWATTLIRSRGVTKKSITRVRVDSSLRSAQCDETIDDGIAVVKRTLHFVRIENQWLFDHAE